MSMFHSYVGLPEGTAFLNMKHSQDLISSMGRILGSVRAPFLGSFESKPGVAQNSAPQTVQKGGQWQKMTDRSGQIGPSKVDLKAVWSVLVPANHKSFCFPPGGLMPQMVALSNFLKRGVQGSHTIPRVEEWNQCLHGFASSSSANGPKHSQFLCWMSPPGLVDLVWIQPIDKLNGCGSLNKMPHQWYASFYAMQTFGTSNISKCVHHCPGLMTSLSALTPTGTVSCYKFPYNLIHATTQAFFCSDCWSPYCTSSSPHRTCSKPIYSYRWLPMTSLLEIWIFQPTMLNYRRVYRFETQPHSIIFHEYVPVNIATTSPYRHQK